ncbi:hemopexin repeat-containing protein [Cellulomonas sp. ICMP 17802]|uniref:hemopexin repeat-containing protein n=1 Tax=Cellulomonas sp. ICMP 17802 TaxID=3239199 RepID=UPI00351AE100
MTARRVYFFSGPSYSRFDHPGDSVPAGYPKDTASSWPGLPGEIDAAVNWGNGKVYFFSGSRYYRYDVLLDKVDDGYPRDIKGAWTDAADPAFEPFNQSVDAAVNWGNGKVYLFKGGQYIRHDIANDMLDPGYPKPVKGNWTGIAGTIFEPGIDAAVNWGNGKVYWFKDDCYGRLDQATKALDPGYPKLITAGWPGVFPMLISAAVEWPMADALAGGFRVPMARGGCEAAPIAGGTYFREYFEMAVEFESTPYPTTCAVGEYRQYVRGQFTVGGEVKEHLLADPLGGPPRPMRPTPPAGSTSDNFLEDGKEEDGKQYYYGHRRGIQFGNSEYTPDPQTGCSFRGRDRPGWPGPTGKVVVVQLDFHGDAVDSATVDSAGDPLVLRRSDWSVNCGGTA